MNCDLNPLYFVQSTGAVTKPKKKRQIASLAWMIILGDGFHSFADGMSIGAAFTENISLGVSISVAVFCEELPHKLGINMYASKKIYIHIHTFTVERI